MVATDLGSGLDQFEAFLDGDSIEIGQEIRVADLSPGSHTLKVIAEDKIGNKSEKVVEFTTVEENPYVNEQPAPADHANEVPLDPKLRVNVQDPTDDPMDVKFLKAYRYDFTNGLNHLAYTGAADREPPLVKTPEGEEVFAPEQYESVAKYDDEYMVTDAVEEFPYQRFEFTINEDVMDARSVDVVWEGHSLPGRRVTMYAWNHKTEQWQELSSKVSETEEDFELKGELNVADMVKDQTASIMIQDLIPTPDDFDFSFTWITDTQNISRSYPEIYDSMTNWIVEQKDTQKIQYVIHTGDIVDSQGTASQWENADRSMRILEEANIPYGVLAGNHDVRSNTSKPINYANYWEWFGRDRFEGQAYYGGDRDNNRDHYDLISYGGHDFVIVYLGWQPTEESYEWANEVLERYSDRNAILAVHQYIASSGKYEGPGKEIFDRIVEPNDNVFLVLNGHALGEPHHNTLNLDGRIVHEVFVNHQNQPEGGMGYSAYDEF